MKKYRDCYRAFLSVVLCIKSQYRRETFKLNREEWSWWLHLFDRLLFYVWRKKSFISISSRVLGSSSSRVKPLLKSSSVTVIRIFGIEKSTHIFYESDLSGNGISVLHLGSERLIITAFVFYFVFDFFFGYRIRVNFLFWKGGYQ